MSALGRFILHAWSTDCTYLCPRQDQITHFRTHCQADQGEVREPGKSQKEGQDDQGEVKEPGKSQTEGQEDQGEVSDPEKGQEDQGELKELGKSQKERQEDQGEPDRRPYEGPIARGR